MRPVVAVAALLTATAAGTAPVVGATRIEIVGTGQRFLQVAEVVATELGAGLDKALTTQGGTAVGEAVYAPGTSDPIKAIDSDTGGNYYSDTFYHSVDGAGFLDVTLAAPTTLSSLALYGRTDCCRDRDVYAVTISNAGGTVLFSGTLDANSLAHSAMVSSTPRRRCRSRRRERCSSAVSRWSALLPAAAVRRPSRPDTASVAITVRSPWEETGPFSLAGASGGGIALPKPWETMRWPCPNCST